MVKAESGSSLPELLPKKAETGEVLFEITTHGEEQIMLEGGKEEEKCTL